MHGSSSSPGRLPGARRRRPATDRADHGRPVRHRAGLPDGGSRGCAPGSVTGVRVTVDSICDKCLHDRAGPVVGARGGSRRVADGRGGVTGTVRTGWGICVLDSLQRRMHALFSLYYDAVATMDLDQVNHVEREGVLPIAFSLFHIVNMIDASFLLMTGHRADLGRLLGGPGPPAIADHGKHRTVEEMVHQRIGDYGAVPGVHAGRLRPGGVVAGRPRPGGADPAGHPPALPRADRQHLQRPGGRSRGHHPARRHRVLDLPARSAAHGGDRAGPRVRRPRTA